LRIKSVEERKALSLIKLRGYKPIKREKQEDTIRFIARIPRKKTRIVISCLLEVKVVGVAYVRKMAKVMETVQAEEGIIVANARYTYAARRDAKKCHIELIPRTFPSFNIFEHKLVPKHEVVSPEETKKLLKKYRVEGHQLPRIKASDVAVIAIGAKPGGIIKITRNSPTAGKHVTYRYVIPG
jgi:DNA-directed RNA polymerase subunit H